MTPLVEASYPYGAVVKGVMLRMMWLPCGFEVPRAGMLDAPLTKASYRFSIISPISRLCGKKERENSAGKKSEKKERKKKSGIKVAG
jgi:hypothetical protein